MVTSTQSRHAAATARMIAAIPADGALVVVHAHSAIAAVRDLILRERGAEVAAGVRVVAAPFEADERAIAAGSVLPVVREPFVQEVRDHALALAEARRATREPVVVAVEVPSPRRGGRRATRFVTYAGRTMPLREACGLAGLDVSTVRQRLDRGLDERTALTMAAVRGRRPRALAA